MSKKTKLSATSEQVDNAFGVLEKALRSTGRLLPKNEVDVCRSEASIDVESVSLPDGLRDPMKTLARGRDVLKRGFLAGKSCDDVSTSEIQKDLQRAARNGKSIANKIQARMSRDRDAAMGKKNKKE